MKVVFPIVFLFSCNYNKVEKHPFKNLVLTIETRIQLDTSAQRGLQSSPPYKIFHVQRNGKDGFLCWNTEYKCFFLSDYDFFFNFKNKEIVPVGNDDAIEIYLDTIYGFNSKSNGLYYLNPRLKKDTQYLPTLKEIPSFYPTTPYRRKLINFDQSLSFIYNYSISEPKKINYIDTTALIILASNDNYKKLGKYPSSYYKKEIRFTEVCFAVNKSNEIYYCHAFDETISRINKNGDLLNTTVLTETPNRKDYKPPKQGALAYFRRFSAENEINLLIEVLKRDKIIVLKKLAQESPLAQPVYKFFIYNKYLQKEYEGLIKHDIIPFIIPFQNGFLIFENGFKNAFKYEIN